ncbi:hypothetical protein [Sulfuricurvum sp.]|uniref:hypothetical protein n=1 Tax=Sulfuricurvum sp. TaxID=2025608 RepID=UPI003BB5E7C8
MKFSFETLTDIDKNFDDEMNEETSIRRRPATQYPEGRTFGECIEDEKRSVRMINGHFVPTIRIIDKPFRLHRNEALKYYTKKL